MTYRRLRRVGGAALVSATAGLGLAGAAVSTGVGVARSHADVNEPRLDHRPKLTSVVLDARQGRDRVVVGASFDNPLTRGGSPGASIAPDGGRQRARVKVVLLRGTTPVATVRSRIDRLALHSAGGKRSVGLAMRLPRGFENERARGDGGEALGYRAQLVHVLASADGDEADRAVTGSRGTVGEVLPGPVRTTYLSTDGKVSLSTVARGGSRYIGEIVFFNSTCPAYPPNESGLYFAVYPTGREGLIDPGNLHFTPRALGGWGWVAGFDTDSEITVTGAFAEDGTSVTVKMPAYTSSQGGGQCSFPKQTVTLPAAGD